MNARLTLVAVEENEQARAAFLRAVIAGLSRRRKAIPCKFLYDERGSALFERICELPEYYPTRTEIELLRARRHEIAALIGPGCRLVDLGAGSAAKARLLLEALAQPRAYLPVDISRQHLLRSAAAIARDHAGLEVVAVCADYTRAFHLPRPPIDAPASGQWVGFFPGSTIGNFTPLQARRFLATTRGALAGGPMVVGVDLTKSPATLIAAYDDAAGVTARFNLNLLRRINRELGGDFRLERFRHRALHNPQQGRVEMHLVSTVAQTVRLGGRSIVFAEGESIHTENSYKYSLPRFSALAVSAGFTATRAWTDPLERFGLFFLQSAAPY